MGDAIEAHKSHNLQVAKHVGTGTSNDDTTNSISANCYILCKDVELRKKVGET